MPPKASRGHVVTKPSHGSDVESANIRRLPHRRPQKICTTERLPALISWALLLITSFAYWICVFPEIINLLPKLLPIFILHCILFIFLCCNFLLATFMDPGIYEQSRKKEYPDISFYVRPTKRKGGLDTDEDEDNYEPPARPVVINNGSVQMKYCRTCKFFRPPRCVHCSICDRCIDTMDHHCPWLNNCVGRRNYRYFFLFLFLLCIHMILLFTFCLYYVLNNRHCPLLTPNLVSDPYEYMVPKIDDETSPIIPTSTCTFIGFSDYRFIVSIILLILLSLFAIPIGGLTGFHVFLIARGRTTNEQVMKKYLHQGDPFTQGFLRNFLYVFCQPVYPQLKSPRIKQYDTELFEKMAYSSKHRTANGKKSSTKKISTKVVYEKTKEDEEKRVKRKKKKKVVRNEHGEKISTPVIHVNPMEERPLKPKPKPKPIKKPIKIPEKQPTSSSSHSSPSSSPIQSIKNPPPPPPPVPTTKTNLRRSLSNLSLSSRYSYDNIDENEEYTVDIHGRRQRPLPPTPIDYLSNNNKPTETNQDTQGDAVSTTSALTLRTESYRQAHPLQSFAFEYPKKPLLAQSTSTNTNQSNGSKKQYEISV